jgi:hypothetical protein
LADEIRALARSTVDNFIKIGRILRRAEEKLPYGAFGEWLQKEFAWSDRTARRLMAIADAFGSSLDTVSKLQIDLTAFHVLAAPTAPPEARDEAVERAKEGEHITPSVARGIVARHRGGISPRSRGGRRRVVVDEPAEGPIPSIDWQRDAVGTIAHLMVSTDREKAQLLHDALADELYVTPSKPKEALH